VEAARASCACRRELRSLGAIRSAALYAGPVEAALHRLKYRGWGALARPLGDLLGQALVVEGLPAAAVLAVPLHPARERRRGSNQSELLARRVRVLHSLPRPAGRLVRMRDTPPQVGLDRLRRKQNVSAAFEWHGAPLRGMPLLLVDDVVTTGATLESCAQALRDAGAGLVTAATVARVRI
jgi:ComF family protein